MIGCGLPAVFFLKDRSKGLKVGYGMISRGEVGLIVAGVAISAGAITRSTYAAILGMIMVTTILAPLLLRRAYEKDPFEKGSSCCQCKCFSLSRLGFCWWGWVRTYPL